MRDEARGSGLAKRLIVYPIHQLLNGSQRMRLPRSADAVTAAATISIFWISTVLEPLPRCALLGRSGQAHGGVSKMTIRKAEKTLQDLFLDGVKDVYYAEKKIVKTLPKMTKAATSPDIKAAFEKHLAETEGHVERLEQVFELLGKPARGKTCPAIDGILEEGAEVMDEYKGTAAWGQNKSCSKSYAKTERSGNVMQRGGFFQEVAMA
jgi:hypothetical protein